MITHYLSPDTKVIVLIALFSFILTFFILTIRSGLKNSFLEIKKHILFDLPNMKAEISLFLVAGIFGVALSSILVGLNLELPFEKFDWIIASILLAIFIILGFIGIHPLITIAIIGNLLNEVNHTLLAITFLMAWSIVISTSPFSGLILTIVSRYNLDIKNIFRLNIFYILKIYVLNIIFLFLLSKYLNI